MDAAVVAALFGSGGVVVALVSYLGNHRKTRAEADSIIVSAANELVGRLTERVAKLEAKVESQESKLAEQDAKLADLEERLSVEQRETRRLRRWVDLLIQQIRGLGVEPVAEPTE